MTDHERQTRPPGNDSWGAVSCLHALAAPGSGALTGWMAVNNLDEAAVEWLRVRGLAPLTYHRLSRAGLLGQAAKTPAALLRLAHYAATDDAERRERDLRRVLTALTAAGITPVLFKGAALTYTVYPDPACRQMGDLDLWLTAEEMPVALSALERIGYAASVNERRPLAYQARYLGEIALKRPTDGVVGVELHWSAFPGVWLTRTAAVDHVAIWQRARPVTVAGCPALALAPEDALIQVAVHLAVNHQMAAPWLRGLLDVALLARAQAVDWATIAERAAGWRVGTAVWLVLQLTVELFGLVEAAPILSRLAPSPVRRRLLDCLVNTASMLALRNLTRTSLRYALLLLLVDRPADAARLAWRALWPEGDWLAARYGCAGAWVRLRHLAGAVRGRV